MKIAIQLFGHMRTWDKTCESLFKYIITPNKEHVFDIFIHTWDELEHTKSRSWYKKDKKISGRKLTQKQIEQIKNKYSPKELVIEEQLPPTDGYNDKRGKNIAHTFYISNQLRIKYKTENSTNYDLIIVTRPDIIFLFSLKLDKIFEDFSPEEIDNTIFYSDIPCLAENPNYNFNNRKFIVGCDLFLMGGKKAINTIAENWYLKKRYLSDERPEWNIAQIIHENNIFLNLFPYPAFFCWDIKRTKEYVDNIFLKPILFFADILASILHAVFIFCPQYRKKCFLGQSEPKNYYNNLLKNIKNLIKFAIRRGLGGVGLPYEKTFGYTTIWAS